MERARQLRSSKVVDGSQKKWGRGEKKGGSGSYPDEFDLVYAFKKLGAEAR